MIFYLYQSQWVSAEKPMVHLYTLELDNPELAIKVMDEEGTGFLSDLLNAHRRGIDCQWGITRSEDLYQEDQLMAGPTKKGQR